MNQEHAGIADAEDLAPAQMMADEAADGPGTFEAEAGEPGQDADPDDSFEIEVDGKVHTIPAALKGAFLRQADYTRKTQELAEHRRAVAAERQAAQGGAGDRAHLAALDQQLAGFAGADWPALAQADPHRAQALWAQFQQTQGLREHYAYALSHHEAHGQLQAAREAADRMAQAGRVLRQEIEGWSPEVAGKLIDYAKAFGVTHDELARTADPRLWKVLHKAWQADQASRDEGVASAAARAQAVRPAVTVAGAAAGGGGVRDELATKEWMKRRNALVWKGR